MSLNDEDRCEELENIIDDLESYANDLNDLKAGFASKDIKGDIKDIVAEINAVKEKYIEEKETVEARLVKEKIAEQGADRRASCRERV